MSYHAVLQEDQRLVIVRSLRDMNGAANESILQTVLQGYGHSISRDKVKTEIRWLEEQGMLTTQSLNGILVCKITQRGLDVAQGHAQVDGIKRPAPVV